MYRVIMNNISRKSFSQAHNEEIFEVFTRPFTEIEERESFDLRDYEIHIADHTFSENLTEDIYKNLSLLLTTPSRKRTVFTHEIVKLFESAAKKNLNWPSIVNNPKNILLSKSPEFLYHKINKDKIIRCLENKGVSKEKIQEYIKNIDPGKKSDDPRVNVEFLNKLLCSYDIKNANSVKYENIQTFLIQKNPLPVRIFLLFQVHKKNHTIRYRSFEVYRDEKIFMQAIRDPEFDNFSLSKSLAEI